MSSTVTADAFCPQMVIEFRITGITPSGVVGDASGVFD
jgi:hypothetical protein